MADEHETLRVEPGSVLIIRHPSNEPPGDDELQSMRDLADDLGVTGIIYLYPGESIATLSDADLDACGLMRKPS